MLATIRTSVGRNFVGRQNCRLFSTSGTEFKLERLTGDDEGIVVLTMDRPKAKNALGRQMMTEFRAALDEVRFDSTVRAIVLQSTVPGVFCAGADLKERATMSEQEVASFVFGLRSAFTGVAELAAPTIAAIEGVAYGGGCELALACDFRVAGSKAMLGLTETGLAIIPGAGGTQRLPRLIGVSNAKRLIFTAKRLRAEEAKDIGLVDEVVEEGNAYDSALSLAREILPNGPVAVRMAKAAIDRGMQVDIATGLAIEQACYAQIIPTKDRIEGLTAFREKRKPVYKGH